MRLLAILLLTATPAMSAEYAHCYLREAPADAPLSTGPNVSGLLSALQTASMKHACGAKIEADLAMLDRILAAGACSPESEVAGYVHGTFEATPEEAMADYVGQSSEAFMAGICEAIETCTPQDNGYGEACDAAIDKAMEGL